MARIGLFLVLMALAVSAVMVGTGNDGPEVSPDGTPTRAPEASEASPATPLEPVPEQAAVKKTTQNEPASGSDHTSVSTTQAETRQQAQVQSAAAQPTTAPVAATTAAVPALAASATAVTPAPASSGNSIAQSTAPTNTGKPTANAATTEELVVTADLGVVAAAAAGSATINTPIPDPAAAVREQPRVAPRKPVPGAVPAGFESLFAEQESLVDVYFGGRFLTSAMARFTPDNIEFVNPGAIVELIPDLLNPDSVVDALSGQLATNQELRCYRKGQPNCGTLFPDTAGVIFNSDSFRADLFINPSLLAVRTVAMDKFLPESDGGLSFLQTFNYAFNGADRQLNEDSNLYALSSIAFEENAIRMVSNYSEQDKFSIDSLVGQRDWQGKRYQVGWFPTDTQDLRFAQQYDIAGFRFGTALDTREDLRQTSGNSIQVFMQSRGEVSIFKDGRLISTKFYDAGNQVLDTTNLPGGSYDIDIRIRDAGGERTETRFYVKNNRLPPADMPLYFIEVGAVTQRDTGTVLPDTIGENLVRGGLNQRINASNSLFGSLAATKNDGSGEFGWFGMGSHYEVTLSAALARHNRRGLYSDARFNWRDMWLSGNYRQIWGDETTDDFGQVNLLGDVQRQANLNLSVPISTARFSFNARYNNRPDTELVRVYSIIADIPVYRFNNSNLLFRMELTRDNETNIALASLDWRTNFSNWTVSVRPEYVSDEINGQRDNYARGTASAGWDSRNDWASDFRATVRATHDRDFDSIGGDVDWGGQYGRARFQAEGIHNSTNPDDARTTAYNGNLATSFMATKDAIVFGGKEQNQSGIIIDVDGEQVGEDVFFEVMIDGVRRGTAQPGRKTVISLRPYQTYKVRLKAQGSSFVYFEDREYDITLYPGNVVRLGWQADSVDVVFGRVVDQNGHAVKNALLKGVAGIATTDDFGLFQAELKGSTGTIKLETRTHECDMEVPEYKTRNGVASLGVMRCDLAPKQAEAAE